MALDRRLRCAVLTLVPLGLAASGFVSAQSSAGLGEIISVTPAMTKPPARSGFDPMLSDRGEIVAVVDPVGQLSTHQSPNVFFVDPPAGEHATRLPGRDVAVSGDGCVGVVTQQGGVTLVFSELCAGRRDRFELLDNDQLILAHPVLSSSGQYLAAETRGRIARLDTTRAPLDPSVSDAENGVKFMPVPPGYAADARFGIDISDDGNIVVATLQQLQFTIASTHVPVAAPAALSADHIVMAWNVTTGVARVISSPTESSAYPSISGEGRWASFASFAEPAELDDGLPVPPSTGGGQPEPTGPWVYVTEIGALDDAADSTAPTDDVVLISDVEAAATDTSMSSDGTQVAYAVVPTGCDSEPAVAAHEKSCRPTRIEVAYGTAPGFTAPFEHETIADSVDAENSMPALSGNGRWVAWHSTDPDLIPSGPTTTTTTPTGSAPADSHHVYMRRRSAGISVSAIDFGEVAPNSTTTALAVVTNTGTSTVSVDEASTTLPAFSVVPGGTCVLGTTTLPPGGSCTIVVGLDAREVESVATATLQVREVGHDAVSGSGSLRGAVRQAPTTTTTTTTTSTSTTSTTSTSTTSTTSTTVPDTTTTTTTAPPETTTTTTTTSPPETTTSTTTPETTTTTTEPEPEGTATLEASPTTIDFGVVPVGDLSAPSAVTIENSGDAPTTPTFEITGEHAGDFVITVDTCSGRELAPGARCTVEVVLQPTNGGVRSATLVGAGSATVEVALRAEAHHSPELVASPAAVTERGVAIIVGQGFPPLEEVVVEIESTGIRLTAHPDELGVFRLPVRPLGTLSLGRYIVRVEGRPTFYDATETALVVVASTFEPRGPTGPIFSSDVILSRGR